MVADQNATGQGPLIIGIGGAIGQGSSSERALSVTLSFAKQAGARTALFAGPDLDMPMYSPGDSRRCPRSRALVAALRAANGVVIASPAYHGSISGLIKNALDYTEDLRGEPLPYLEGRPVGAIACARGDQAIGTTLMTMRAITHALRGWPTPLSVGINTGRFKFDENGIASDDFVATQLRVLAEQIVDFASLRTNARVGGWPGAGGRPA
jgi:FMN reductase